MLIHLHTKWVRIDSYHYWNCGRGWWACDLLPRIKVWKERYHISLWFGWLLSECVVYIDWQHWIAELATKKYKNATNRNKTDNQE